MEEDIISQQQEPSCSVTEQHDKEDESPNFNLGLFNGPPAKSAKRFATLTEDDLDTLVAERYSDRTKKTTNWSVSTFRGKQ